MLEYRSTSHRLFIITHKTVLVYFAQVTLTTKEQQQKRIQRCKATQKQPRILWISPYHLQCLHCHCD